MFIVNLKKNGERYLKTAAMTAASVLIFGATTARAQPDSINDDLKPKPKPVKSKAAAKPIVQPAAKTPVKTVKKTGSRSAKKPGGASPRTQNSGRAENSASVFSETPDQILNRYMNFQQSAGVTARDWNKVIAQTEKTLKENPNHAVAKAQSLLAQGQIAHGQGGYALAMTHYKDALKILPTSSVLHYSLGKTYLANGQAEAAERSFETAIKQNKKFALAYKGLGDAFEAQGEKKTAVKYFKKATEASVKDGNMNP